MKNVALITAVFILLPCSLIKGQEVVPLTKNQQIIRGGQYMAEDVWEQQDRQKAEWVKSLPIRKFTMATKKTFKGRLIGMQDGKVITERDDQKVFYVPITKFSTADQKYIRAELAARKNPNPQKAKVKKTTNAEKAAKT